MSDSGAPRRPGLRYRRHVSRWLPLALVAVTLARAAPARAQDTRWLVQRGPVTRELAGMTPVEDAPRQHPGIDPEHLAVLRRLETLLSAAREAAANLDDEVALARLVEARNLGDRAAAVPGAARYLAEVEATLGVVASQAGLSDLADEALRRAITLDPERVLRAGEAPPALVERSVALSREAAVAPRGSFVVSAESAGAQVYLDGRLAGTAPARVEAGVGRHLIRVEAPGRRPWGAFVDVLEGERAPLAVALSPTERERRRHRIAAAHGPTDAASELIAGEELFWVESQEDGRTIMLRCQPQGCAPVERLRAGEGLPLTLEPTFASLRESELGYAEARAWLLGEDPELVARRARTIRWGSIIGAGVAAIAGAVVVGWAARPEPEQRLVLTIDLADLM